MDSKFQGTYDVRTSLSDAFVLGPGLDDLIEGDQQRQYVQDFVSPQRSIGWVGWDDRPSGDGQQTQGQIEVVSSLSPAILLLGSSPDDYDASSKNSRTEYPKR